MRAFLSHSSRDKSFVSQVAAVLGPLGCEYDEYTFEYTLNTQAIRSALNRCNMFVLFLSANSVNSDFVSEEIRTALEGRAKGLIKQIMIFTLDMTSYSALPSWLQEINVVRHLSSPKACGRKIQASLFALEADTHPSEQTYLGRDDEELALRRALAVAPGNSPIVLHAVGHYGIGRRTFLRNSLKKFYPRLFESFPEISLQRYEGPEELYRQLYELHEVSSIEQSIRDFEAFGSLTPTEQAEKIADILTMLTEAGDFVLIDDFGGAYDDEGAYQPYLKLIINQLKGAPRPIFGFIQTRMMPHRFRVEAKATFHSSLKSLSDVDIRDLMSFSLRDAGIDFSDAQLSELSELIDGHPFNVRFAIEAIKSYGLESFAANPADLIEWKLKRAEDFLRLIAFSRVEEDLVAALAEYRYLPLELFSEVTGVALPEVASALRRLEEHCCIERRETYFELSSPIRDAIRRDKRFERTDEWKRQLSLKICEILAQYTNDDHVPVSLLETAVLASVRGVEAPPYVSRLLLPSHMLTIARRYYDKPNFGRCIEFCRKAFESKSKLTRDAQIEVLRLWGLSAVRSNDDHEVEKILQLLSGYGEKTAKRNQLFIEGLRYRLRKELDLAEEKFLECWRINRSNHSANRELASLYCRQKRYNEAETFARSAYDSAPTNPYLIDILAETLLGKAHSGLSVDSDELARLMSELKRYGDAPGSSFFLIRTSQSFYRDRKYPQALDFIDRAIEKTSNLLPPYFLRADIHIALNNVPAAERDLTRIDQLLQEQGRFSEADEVQMHDLKVRILIEKKQFKAAKQEIERHAFMPKKVAKRLLQQLARAVGFNPTSADDELRKWAARYNGR